MYKCDVKHQITNVLKSSDRLKQEVDKEQS